MVGDIITNVLIAVAVTFFLGYITSTALKFKAKVDATPGERTFSCVRGFKALALISVVLPAFMGALSLQFYRAGESDYLVWLGICLIFTAMSGYLLLECFFARLVVSKDWITSLSRWSGHRTFRWGEIDSIRYSNYSKLYVIVGPGGKKIYASEYLSGFGELSAEFRKKIPPERWLCKYPENAGH